MYTPDQLNKIRGCAAEETPLYFNTTISAAGSSAFRDLLTVDKFVPALGALSGQQAVQQARAGLRAIYVSGWQVAAANNTARDVYPDQSIYPVDSVPQLVKEIQLALRRARQIEYLAAAAVPGEPLLLGKNSLTHSAAVPGEPLLLGKNSLTPSKLPAAVPIIADAEAGFGGPVNAFDLTLKLIEQGAAAVHFEDQLSAEKKCGHLGGKVLVSTRQFIQTLRAVNLAKEAFQPDLVIIARTDAESARYITNDADARDTSFIDYKEERSSKGFYQYRGSLDAAVSRALAYAPYCDILWIETSTPDLEAAEYISSKIHEVYPGKWLAYNCSPSFNWSKFFPARADLAAFQQRLAEMGFVFQFVTLAGYHSMNQAMFELAREYLRRGMEAYSSLQEAEANLEEYGYTSRRHQQDAGVGYFDNVQTFCGQNETTALATSTEKQFNT